MASAALTRRTLLRFFPGILLLEAAAWISLFALGAFPGIALAQGASRSAQSSVPSSSIHSMASNHSGGLRCAVCHAAQAGDLAKTDMGRALELSGSNPVLESHPLLTVRRGKFLYTIETKGHASTYSVTDGVRTIQLPITWGMGAKAQTWLLTYRGQYYESMVSYYPTIDGLDVTTGDDDLKPDTLEAAIGRIQSEADTRICFNCHASDAVVGGKLSLATMKPGLACERCHTGSLEHLKGIEQGRSDAVIPPKLAQLSTEQISDFCGQCHRTWESIVRQGQRGTADVRFPAYRIANSRCFDGTDPRIACTACHDPHHQIVSDQAFYDSKCQACHAPSAIAHVVATSGRDTPKSCPVAQSGCVSCHMPRTRMVDGHLYFNDHQIRIVRPGDTYPN